MKPIFKRFNDLTINDLNFNFHIHTDQTDGISTPEEIIDKAIELKLKAIAFTEHVNKDSDWFDVFAVKIKNFKKDKKLKIFLGIETKTLDFNGTLDATLNMIDKSDIIVGVVHRYFDDLGASISPEEMRKLDHNKSADIELKLSMGLLKNKNIDVLGHPFGIYSKLYSDIPENHMKQLLTESVKHGKVIEINTKYITNPELFFKLCKQINPYISIGSDAHNKDELIRSYDLLRKSLRQNKL